VALISERFGLEEFKVCLGVPCFLLRALVLLRAVPFVVTLRTVVENDSSEPLTADVMVTVQALVWGL
jgi:hypothetical protein